MIRLATHADLPKLLRWRNEAEFVELSAGKRMVRPTDHAVWFEQHEGHIWVIKAADKQDCGVIWVSHGGVLSISIEKPYSSHGLGTDAVKDVQRKLRTRLIAYLQPTNAPSRGLFEAAGFVPTRMEWRP